MSNRRFIQIRLTKSSLGGIQVFQKRLLFHAESYGIFTIVVFSEAI